jgi:hypothetical protein
VFWISPSSVPFWPREGINVNSVSMGFMGRNVYIVEH